MRRRSKVQADVQIDVIRTDILLWCLEGFSEAKLSPQMPCWSRGYPLNCWKEMARIALKDRADYGEVRCLADKFRLDRNSLAVLISRLRCGRIGVPQAFTDELE